METKVFSAGAKFESNTVYKSDRAVYHIHLDDSEYGKVNVYSGESPALLHVGFVLRNLENVTVDLNGAKLIFHGRILPFLIDHCKNVALKNFSIDFDRPFYTQGDILEADTNCLKLKIGDAFPCRVEEDSLIVFSDTWENRLDEHNMLFQPFDRDTLAPAYDAGCILAVFGKNPKMSENPPLPIHRLAAENGPGGTVILRGDFPDTYKAGQILAMTHEVRTRTGFQLEHSFNTTLDNVRLIHVGAMGLTANLCENITLRRFNMFLDKESKGVVTINADSVHCFHCTGKIIIEDCIFENMLDDAVNIHGNYSVADRKIDRNRIAVRLPAHGLDGMEMYTAGDEVKVFRGRTQEYEGSYTVKAAEYTGKNEITLTTHEPIGNFNPGDVIESQRMPEIEIRRCRTGRNRPRGFLLSSGKKTVVENCFFNNCSAGVHFTGDTTYWYESGPVGDVTISGCRFKDCGYCSSDFSIISTPEFESTPQMPFYHKNIKIINNTFETFADGVLYAKYTDDIVYKDNVYIQTDSYPKRRSTGRVVLEHCGKADID